MVSLTQVVQFDGHAALAQGSCHGSSDTNMHGGNISKSTCTAGWYSKCALMTLYSCVHQSTPSEQPAMPGDILLSSGATYTRTSEVALPTRLSAASSWTVLLSGRRGSSPLAVLLCSCSSCTQLHDIHLPLQSLREDESMFTSVSIASDRMHVHTCTSCIRQCICLHGMAGYIDVVCTVCTAAMTEEYCQREASGYQAAYPGKAQPMYVPSHAGSTIP